MMVEWILCPSCRKVVDEFEDKCGWCFPKKTIVKSDKKQLLLFDMEANFEEKDYFNSECAHKVRE
jgi:hypothetical protein